MDIDKHVRETLVAYGAAHAAWKRLPDGPAKVDAKRLRGQLHGKVLELAEQLAKTPP